MSSEQHIVATLSLNKPVQGGDDHWIVALEETDSGQADAAAKLQIPLAEGTILRIGRASSNDLVIRSKLASRYHALLSATRCGVVLCDLDSLNGCYINGFRVEAPQDISNGDTLRIGEVEMRVSMRLSRSIDPVSASRSQHVTPVGVVLFAADLFDYREMLSKSAPEFLTPCLQQWFSFVREAVVANGGRIDRFLGDGVLAYWIGPVAQIEGLAKSALRAAGQLQAWTSGLPKVSESALPWSCAISLVAGECLSSSASAQQLGDPIFGTLLNEALAINTKVKRERVLLSCNEKLKELLRVQVQTKLLAEIRSPAIVGEVLTPYEIVGSAQNR